MPRILFILCGFCCAATILADDVTYDVAGLDEPAEIIIDEWGVPHIYAGTHYDAFFAQGFNAARDRLWQIDTWRRRGLGLLSEVLGPDYLEQDRAARLFLYRGDMYREWLAYGSDAKRIAEAFVAGINAYVDLIDAEPDLLPVEFRLLNYSPARWGAEDVVRVRTHGIMRNVSNEVRRARIACESDLAMAENWITLDPPWTTEVPDGLDPCSIPEGVLRIARLARAPVRFEPQQVAAVAQSEVHLSGSNNWAVAPHLTATGRPVLANDPHRGHSVPSLRYIAHLVAPGLNVIGAGEPALPGLSIGHNERIAFGLTVFGIDQEDLYVYEKGDGGYRYGDAFEAFLDVSEEIPVRGAESEQVTLRYTRHGPVIHEDDARAFAIRSVWSEPGTSAYFGSVEYMRASNWREFVAALNRWGTPAENQVYADVDGNVGYKPAGTFPRRPNWDGLLPVPGDGRYEWDGFHDMDVLPEEYNPERGYTVTANAMDLPADYPIAQFPVGFDVWAEPWRLNRLHQVLTAADDHTLDDSIALQNDYQSLLAVALQERLARLAGNSEAPAIRRLLDWDARLTSDSSAAALYAIWAHRHLIPAFATVVLPTRPDLIASSRGWRGLLRYIDEEEPVVLLLETLIRAERDAIELLGPDADSWRWGDLHKARFAHPLSARFAETEFASAAELPEYPRGGDGTTTNVNTFNVADFSVVHGASFSMVLDVGNWDASRMTNTPGQSGDPFSPFYDNLLAGWAADETFPLLYSRKAILEHAVRHIRLVPADE